MCYLYLVRKIKWDVQVLFLFLGGGGTCWIYYSYKSPQSNLSSGTLFQNFWYIVSFTFLFRLWAWEWLYLCHHLAWFPTNIMHSFSMSLHFSSDETFRLQSSTSDIKSLGCRWIVNHAWKWINFRCRLVKACIFVTLEEKGFAYYSQRKVRWTMLVQCGVVMSCYLWRFVISCG